ncbi:3-phosphoshikimate 1-carboxyvinyltransferase [Micrococcus lylae]|uniref:3-phosphoshikimate 1-carboxyvinyltransferase n=1 Tax=Micrococcus lylae TaxID=1273 RepID=UPI003D6CD682
MPDSPMTSRTASSPAASSAAAGTGRWPDPWPAPYAAHPVEGTVELPGSKSLTNRWLVLAAIASGPCTLHGVLRSRDTDLMRAALTALGAGFTDGPEGALHVTPLPVGEPLPAPVEVDCGLAGTVMRFLPLVAALRPGTVRLDGDPGARVRPMGATVQALRGLGVHVTEEGEPGRLPLTLTVPDLLPDDGPRLGASPTGASAGSGTAAADGTSRVLELDASESSQFLSAALLSACAYPGGLTARHAGATVPSPEHVGMTLAALTEVGVPAEALDARTFAVPGARPRPFAMTVEPDLSNAGPFLAAAAVTGGTVRIPRWPAETTQIGQRWRDILPAFGARVEFIPDAEDPAHGVLEVCGGRDAAGDPVVCGAGEVPDTAELAPTVAALALLAEGPTQLTRIGHLRGHETDRLAALTAEAARFGVHVSQGADRLDFPGSGAAGDLTPAEARTYHDHRMATFAAVVGLAVPGTTVRDVGTTAKTMPDFPAMWEALVRGEET